FSSISADFQKSGGLLEVSLIAGLAGLYEIPIAPHNLSSALGIIASCHVGSTLANFMVLEFHGQDVPFWDDLVTGVPKPLIQKGLIQVPSVPGLGVELNETVAKEYAKAGEPIFA